MVEDQGNASKEIEEEQEKMDSDYSDVDDLMKDMEQELAAQKEVKNAFFYCPSSKNQAGAIIVWHENENRLSTVPIDAQAIGQDLRPYQVAQVAGSLIAFTEGLTSNIAVTRIDGLADHKLSYTKLASPNCKGTDFAVVTLH